MSYRLFLPLILSILTSSLLSGQKLPHIETPVESYEVGINYITGKPIYCNAFNFIDPIISFELNQSDSLIFLTTNALFKNEKRFNETGKVILFDPTTNNRLWTYEAAHANVFSSITDKAVIKKVGPEFHYLDKLSLNTKWVVSNNISFINHAEEIGFGYKLPITLGAAPNKLRGIDLNNGRIIWERKIPRVFGWNKVHVLNDSINLIVGQGLHYLNIKDGTGWDYPQKTGSEALPTAQRNYALNHFYLGTEDSDHPPTRNDIYRNINSNVIFTDYSLYFSSEENIAKLSSTGNIIWQTKLPELNSSRSHIALVNNKILHINYGNANLVNDLIRYGRPFIALYDIKDGKQIYLNYINVEKMDFIRGVKIVDNDLLILTANRLLNVSISDGSKISDQEMPFMNPGNYMTDFIREDLLVKKDSSIYSLNDGNENFNVLTSDTNIFVFNKSLELIDQISAKNIYLNQLDFNNYKLVSSFLNHSYIIDSDGNINAKLNIPFQLQRLGSKQYRFDESYLFEIDKKDLLRSFQR